MQQAKRERLEQLGWAVGNAEAFLQLTPEEVAYVERKLALSEPSGRSPSWRKCLESST